MYYPRKIEESLLKQLFKGKVIVLYGPRQAGKTTLVKHLIEPFLKDVRFIDCELIENKDILTRRATDELFALVKGYKIVVFDEAQTIKGIGSVLKSLFDHHPEVQYIATGSSSFDLANEVSEPLTGRSVEYTLLPISILDLVSKEFDAEQKIKEFMLYGSYPDIINLKNEEKISRLKTITSQYLYKNVLAIGGIKKPEIIIQLLKLLAYQIGNEFTYRELAKELKTSPQTVMRYIDLLEKTYIIKKIGSFSKNLRGEVTQPEKIYFIDLGIRNSLIDNFQPINTTGRNDVGGLFENAMIIERMKHLFNTQNYLNASYFWRNYKQQEIDYIEERGGNIYAYEFKWNSDKRTKIPEMFKQSYPKATVKHITPKNIISFVSESTN